ncbi:MAG: S1C family serine protease [Rudaea sp.]
MPRSVDDNKRHFQSSERTQRILRQARASQAQSLTAGETTDKVKDNEFSLEIQQHWRGLAISAFAALVGLLVLVAALSVQSVANGPNQQAQINAAVARALASATPQPPMAEKAFAAVQPALVQVLAQDEGSSGKGSISYGSGVVINKNGLILTSLHIVRGSPSIEVIFADGTQSYADLEQIEESNDIAFLKPQDPPDLLFPAVLGNPHALQIGDPAIVVGNPMQLAGSLSAGVISGLERTFQPPNGAPPMQHMIQIDAAVNPGNSGGPLLNQDGQVVGVITGRASPSGQEAFYGIGFAVPIDEIMSVNGPLPY